MMVKKVTPPVPEQVRYICDRCLRVMLPDQVDARVERMDRDLQGGIVYSHELHLCQRCRRSLDEWMTTTDHQWIDIVFDGPPSHESGRFVEVELPDGRSVNAGEWIDRKNGLWALRLRTLATQRKER